MRNGFAKKRLTGLYGSYDKCTIFLAAVLFRSIIYAKYNLKNPFHSGGNQIQSLPFHAQRIMETSNVVLTFESVDEILWCDHSNETSSAVLLHGAICFSV